MNYGGFSTDGREFVIDRPDTPRPWINYLCNRNGNYVSLLSANAGGYSFVGCPKDGRITRWRYNSLPDDRPGRYVYLKSADDNDTWTLSWQPTAKPVEHYSVRHGLGYTIFSCDYHDIEAQTTCFVPLDDSPEICNRAGYEKWAQEGAVDIVGRARERAKRILATHEPERLRGDIDRTISKIITQFEATKRRAVR